MNKQMISLIILLLIGTIAGAAGQVLLKIGINEIGIIKYSNISASLNIILKIITNRFVITGLILSVVAAFSGIIMLSQNNLSFIYPLGVGLLFVAVLIFSKIFLKETIYFGGWLGVFLILAGIIIIFKAK